MSLDARAPDDDDTKEKATVPQENLFSSSFLARRNSRRGKSSFFRGREDDHDDEEDDDHEQYDDYDGQHPHMMRRRHRHDPDQQYQSAQYYCQLPQHMYGGYRGENDGPNIKTIFLCVVGMAFIVHVSKTSAPHPVTVVPQPMHVAMMPAQGANMVPMDPNLRGAGGGGVPYYVGQYGQYGPQQLQQQQPAMNFGGPPGQSTLGAGPDAPYVSNNGDQGPAGSGQVAGEGDSTMQHQSQPEFESRSGLEEAQDISSETEDEEDAREDVMEEANEEPEKPPVDLSEIPKFSFEDVEAAEEETAGDGTTDEAMTNGASFPVSPASNNEASTASDVHLSQATAYFNAIGGVSTETQQVVPNTAVADAPQAAQSNFAPQSFTASSSPQPPLPGTNEGQQMPQTAPNAVGGFATDAQQMTPNVMGGIATEGTQVTMTQQYPGNIPPQPQPSLSGTVQGQQVPPAVPDAVGGVAGGAPPQVTQSYPANAVPQPPPPLPPPAAGGWGATTGDLSLMTLGNYKDSWDPYERSDIPVFWHIPKAGGSTVKDVIGTCHRFVMATEFGVTDGHDQDTAIAVVYPATPGAPPGQDRSPFVNVDTTTVAGIERAKQMRFADSGLADAVVSPFIYEANDLFTPTAKGRLFTVFRHPIDRAISLFYYIQVADWEPTYSPELKDWSLEQYATSTIIENNWMTRQLSNQLSGDLTDENLQVAKEVIRRKFMVGLMTKIGETMERFEKFYRWKYHVNPTNQEACRNRLLSGGSNSNKSNKKAKPKEGSREWELLAWQNQYDLQLYEYIEQLFVEQAQLVANIPDGFRKIDATCCKCSPPTFPPEGFTCPQAVVN